MSKKLVSLLLVLLMLLSTSALAEIPDYINLENERPIVKDGETVSLKLLSVSADAYASNPEDVWLWAFIREKLNMNIEVEHVLSSAAEERLTLMMVADELPDIMIGFGIGADKQMRYGVLEGQLLNIAPYLSEELTPNMMKMFRNFPNVLPTITAPDGGIYSVFNYGMDVMPSPHAWLLKDWLDEKGIESPRTLDEFTELLRAFKAEYPDSTPMGGSSTANDPRAYLLNAFGYLTSNGDGIKIAVRNGEAVIPAADAEYKEYLEVMKSYYDEGLISRDFFTLETTAVNAQLAEKQNVFSCVGAPYNVLPDPADFQQWWGAYPLTSEWNDTAACLAGNYIRTGGMVFSAKTKYPEVCVRFADYFFGNEGGIYKWDGPCAGTEDCLGMIEGFLYVEDGTSYTRPDAAKFPSGYAFLASVIAPWGGSESFGYRKDIDDPTRTNYHVMQKMAGVPEIGTVYDPNVGDHWYRMGMEDVALPYQQVGYPNITWFTADESVEMNEIITVVEPFMKTETAKFITGVRPLDEFDQYLNELKGMGIDTLLGYYVKAYEAFKAN